MKNAPSASLKFSSPILMATATHVAETAGPAVSPKPTKPWYAARYETRLEGEQRSMSARFELYLRARGYDWERRRARRAPTRRDDAIVARGAFGDPTRSRRMTPASRTTRKRHAASAAKSPEPFSARPVVP